MTNTKSSKYQRKMKTNKTSFSLYMAISHVSVDGCMQCNYQHTGTQKGSVSLTNKNYWKEESRVFALPSGAKILETNIMAFFQSAVGSLQTIVIALGAGLGVWGAINLLEGYGNDNPGAKSQGMKQLMAGGGVALVGTTLVPLLAGLF